MLCSVCGVAYYQKCVVLIRKYCVVFVLHCLLPKMRSTD